MSGVQKNAVGFDELQEVKVVSKGNNSIGTGKVNNMQNPAKLQEKKNATLLNMMKKKQEI